MYKFSPITTLPVRPEERQLALDAITAVESKLAALKPHKDRARRVREDRKAIEALGAAALQEPNPEHGDVPRSACCYVRLWYRSQGDEVLAFDAGPMTRARASSLAGQYETEHVWGGRRSRVNSHSDSLGAVVHTMAGIKAPHNVPEVYRLITLPSQMPESERVIVTSVEPEPCADLATVRAELESIAAELADLRRSLGVAA